MSGRQAPQGVRLVLRDGRQVPVGVRYSHTDEDGVAMWELITDIAPGEATHLRVDVLPGRTGLAFPRLQGMTEPEEEPPPCEK